ncbi:MAG TPA: hypothetical protein VHF22_05900, partial [Planctomycetota bacterium]|nr:hypothetical protein [Planctomycetota bacterium]
MDRLEKIVWIVTALAVLGVIGFAVIGPLKSEVAKETEQHDFEMANPQLARGRRSQQPQVSLPGPYHPQAQGPGIGGNIAAAPAGARPGSLIAKPVGAKPPAPSEPAWQPPRDPGTVI